MIHLPKKNYMQKVLMVILVTSLLFSCDVRNLKDNKDVVARPSGNLKFKDSTTVQVIDSTYDFGKVTDGEKVAYNFRFKNTGPNPLIIESALPSCGCTIAEKPEKPVLTGETGSIKVVFNSSGRVGEAHKDINVISNAYPLFPALHLKGTVINK